MESDGRCIKSEMKPWFILAQADRLMEALERNMRGNRPRLRPTYHVSMILRRALLSWLIKQKISH